MALGSPYLDVDQFRARSGSNVSGSDDAILSVVTSASRQIDGWCGREFNNTETASIRYFSLPSWGSPAMLEVDEFVSLSAVAVDNGARTWSTVWDAADYVAGPMNAAGKGEPYTRIDVVLNSVAFPFGRDFVKVTAVWGWPEIPTPVKEATYLISNRLKSLWNAPFGSTSAGELGSGLNMTGALDPIIKGMLMPFRVVVV